MRCTAAAVVSFRSNATAKRLRPRGGVLATLAMTALAASVSACNVGPDFETPKVPMNRAWSEANDPRLVPGSEVDAEWWKTFQDPTLDQLVELAYKQNLSLRVAGLRILEARAVLGVAVGEQLPSNVLPIGSASATKLSTKAPNTELVDDAFGEFKVGFDVLWEVDFWGKYRRGVNSAEASYLATVADYDAAVVAVTAEVAQTYVVIRRFEALLEQARQNVGLQEEGQEIAESRFRNGATSELDVAQATNLLETTRASVPKLEIGLRQAENALSTLLGRPTGHIRGILATTRVIPAPPPQVHISVPSLLLRRRPDIRSAELQAAAQCERIGMAEAELYPSFVLQGSIASHTSVGTANAAPLFAPGTLAASTGANLFWPILNYPRLLENVRVEDARFQQALVVYVETVLRAAQEVEDGMVGFLRQQEAVGFEEDAVIAAESAVELALVQYREGAVDYQRVLDTQRVLLASQNSLIDSRAETATNLISLYKALGGGWETRRGGPFVDEETREEMEERTNWGAHFPKSEAQPPPKTGAPPAARVSSQR